MEFDQPTLNANELTAALHTTRIGRTVHTFTDAASTNDICWQHLGQIGPAADGCVVIADYQTAGRGRFNRAWLAPRASSLLLSTLILQLTEPLLTERLPLIAGIAGCTACRRISDVEVQLRWPNDLYYQRKKLGGVLIESRPWQAGWMAVVIGIGINCLQHPGHFPPELRRRAASLDMISPNTISRFDLAVELIRHLDGWLAGHAIAPAEQVRMKWLELAEPLGQRVCLIHAGQRLHGTTVELDPTGGLLVQLESGGRRIFNPATTTLEVTD